MESSVQNGPKTRFFKDYSLLVVFTAYLRSKCTIPDIYTYKCAGLVVIRSLRTRSARLVQRKKERKRERKRERETVRKKERKKEEEERRQAKRKGSKFTRFVLQRK